MQISIRSRLFRLIPTICTAALLAAIPAGYADHKGKPHGKGGPDRIPGCVTFAAGNAVTDDDPVVDAEYCDGFATKNNNGDDDSMQIAMNCEFNHFNVYPGGGVDAGGRYLFVTIAPESFMTGITSCPNRNAAIAVDFVDTAMNNPADCDFNFDQLLRSDPTTTNVCNIKKDDAPLPVKIRFQNNIHHQTDCRGGNNKCGNKLEAFEIFYDGRDTACPKATIICGDEDENGACNQWIVSAGNGCVVNGSGMANDNYDLSFTAIFTPL